MAVTALGALMAEQKERLDISYRQMEMRAGGRLKAKRFQQLTVGPLDNVPPTDTLRTIADVLQLPVSVVTDAALESVGLRRTAAPSSRWVTIAQAAEEMPEATRRALERQVEALLDLYRGDAE